MKCYFTGEECDCDGDMDTECPHDEMVHDVNDFEEMLEVEHQMSAMSERLDQCLRP